MAVGFSSLHSVGVVALCGPLVALAMLLDSRKHPQFCARWLVCENLSLALVALYLVCLLNRPGDFIDTLFGPALPPHRLVAI